MICSTIRRYGFPRPVIKKSDIVCVSLETEGYAHKINLKRTLDNEYINTYNEMMMRFFKKNHEVRFIIGSADETYYALKYSRKSNQ